MNTITLAVKIKRIDFKTVGQWPLTEMNVVWAEKRKKPDKNGNEWDDLYIDVKYWGQTQGLNVDDHCIVYGKLKQETWEKDGKRNYKTFIQAEHISKNLFNTASGKPPKQGHQQDYSQQKPPQQNPMGQAPHNKATGFEEEGIPF